MMKYLLFLAIIASFFSFLIPNNFITPLEPLPIVADDLGVSVDDGPTFRSLNTLKNLDLETRLLNRLKKNKKYRSLIRNKKLSIGLVDMKDQSNVRFASVNGEEMMYAASLPKIAILLAATDAIDKGELKETAAVRKDMTLMIRKSNNAASTRMIDRVGYQKIARVMKDPRYNLYDIRKGGLWVGKRYAAGGARNPEPIKGLSHAASANKVCDYYYMLSQGELVNPKCSKKMMSYLSNPGINHKFVNTLRKVAPLAELYRKSGSWRTFHSDSVWVNGPDRNYILVALINDASGESIARDMVKVVEEVLNN